MTKNSGAWARAFLGLRPSWFQLPQDKGVSQRLQEGAEACGDWIRQGWGDRLSQMAWSELAPVEGGEGTGRGPVRTVSWPCRAAVKMSLPVTLGRPPLSDSEFTLSLQRKSRQICSRWVELGLVPPWHVLAACWLEGSDLNCRRQMPHP